VVSGHATRVRVRPVLVLMTWLAAANCESGMTRSRDLAGVSVLSHRDGRTVGYH
jgi:hypothetical protein